MTETAPPTVEAADVPTSSSTLRARVGVALRSVARPRQAFWVSFALFTALFTLWSLASPRSSGPDESSHVVKAAALMRGQVISDKLQDGWTPVQLPELYHHLDHFMDCYRFRPEIPASCVTPLGGDLDTVVLVTHSAGAYNPLYYAIIGAPTLLPPDQGLLYLVRLLSSALCAFTLALGVRTIAESRRPAWPTMGILVAVVPMVLYLGGVVNPSAVEATAGLGLWVVLLTTLRDPDPDLLRRRMLRAGTLVVLLVNSKSLSPLFLAVIVIASALMVPWSAVRAMVTDRRSWPGFGLGTLGIVTAGVWMRINPTAMPASLVSYPELSPRVAGDIIVRETGDYITNMLGQFGWVDTNLPVWLYIWLGGLWLALILLALAVGSVRERSVLIGTGLLVLSLPLVLQVPFARSLGIQWQGRYLEALYVGLPVLASVVCARHTDLISRTMTRKLAAVIGTAMLVAQMLAYVVNLRRYVAGANAPYFAPVENPWVPPLPVPVLLLGFALGLVALGLLAHALVTRAEVESPAEVLEPAPGDDPDEVAAKDAADVAAAREAMAEGGPAISSDDLRAELGLPARSA